MLGLQAGLVHAGEAIAGIPNMLTAICLNTEGLALVKDSDALDCLVPVLTTPSYIRALNVSLFFWRLEPCIQLYVRQESGSI